MALQCLTGISISLDFDGIQPSFLFGWFSGFHLPSSPATPPKCHGPFMGKSPSAWFRDWWLLLLDSGSFRVLYRHSRFSLMGCPGTRPSRGPFRGTAATLPHRVADTSLLPILHGGEGSHAPGRHSGTFSFPSHRTRCCKSTAA